METEWDVVVVGAGSAGAALAARLSEDAGKRVLLLEAGSDRAVDGGPAALHSLAEPLALADRTKYPDFQWQRLSARITDAQAPGHYPRGYGVGGTSTINGRIALRPPLDEFVTWERVAGPGWGSSAVLESFIRLEDERVFGDRSYHGRGGPTPISHSREDDWGAFDIAVRDAALACGHRWYDDINDPANDGVAPVAYNGVEDTRYDVNLAYLGSARGRPNFGLVCGALVDRVLFADDDFAVGVAAVVNGVATEYRADEVVLCAGAIHSPAILQRSGIGPAERLRALGIAVRADLPVGENLQEHPAILIALPGRDGGRPGRGLAWSVLIRASTGQPDSLASDVMIASARSTPEMFARFPYIVLGGILEHVWSTGSVMIRSLDPSEDPAVEIRAFSDERDLRRMQALIRMIGEMAASSPLAAAAAGEPVGLSTPVPGAPPRLDGPLAQLDARWIFETAATTWHPSSTCALGAVVDPAGAVHGISNLRVADLSIAPTVPRANTNLTAIMIGEHVAALIRGR